MTDSKTTDLDGFPGHPTAAEIGLTDAEIEVARAELRKKFKSYIAWRLARDLRGE